MDLLPWMERWGMLPPKGGVLLFREAYHPGLSQYIRYILPESRRKRPPGRPEKAE